MKSILKHIQSIWQIARDKCSMLYVQYSFLFLFFCSSLNAQQITLQDTLTARLNDYFSRYEADEIKLVGVKTDSHISVKLDVEKLGGWPK